MLSGLLKRWQELAPMMTRMMVGEASFYHWHHRLAFRRLSQCVDPGPLTLYMRLRWHQEANEWPDLPRWIAGLWELDPTGCSFEWAAAMVRRAEVRRRIIGRAGEAVRDARRARHSPEEYERILAAMESL